MRIAIGGPDLNSVDFNKILDIYKQHTVGSQLSEHVGTEGCSDK